MRVESNALEGLPNVAYQTPEGKQAVIVLNEGKEEREFGIGWQGKVGRMKLKGGSVGTLIW